ncbi:MAG: hypothetical protein DK306_001008 [Chloroflexi bacterium]|nr:MAG: hypothetical protein DK306_001008 [Chloroflexota bacterium]
MNSSGSNGTKVVPSGTVVVSVVSISNGGTVMECRKYR